MDRVYPIIEQLDVARELLADAQPLTGRLALILIDNAIELVLHASCENEIRVDEMGDGLRLVLPAKYDQRTRRAALGQRFDAKLKFCRELGMLTEREARSVAISHSYRNELYHTGIRYDPIIPALAWEYFGIACQLIPEFRSGVFWKVQEPTSERVAKYFPEAVEGWPDPDGFGRVAERLLAARPPRRTAPTTELSAFAVSLVEEAEEALEFLVADNFQGWDEATILEEIQFHYYVWEEENEPRVETTGVDSVRELHDKLAALRQGWAPRYATSPLPRWKKRAGLIAGSPDWHHALQRFHQLRQEMAYLAGVLDKAAMELDRAI